MARKPAYEQTSVSVDRSMAQIRKMLNGYGVAQLVFREFPAMFEIGFILKKPKDQENDRKQPEADRQKWELPVSLQFSTERVFKRLVTIHPRTSKDALRERALKTAWRQAYHYLKATLEAVDLGLFTIYQALLAGFVDAHGQTLGLSIAPRLEEWAANNRLGLLGAPDIYDEGGKIDEQS